MYADISKPPAPLPEPELREIQPGLKLLPPLTRCGRSGPGIVIVVPENHASLKIEQGVPSLSIKWAEEGYTVAEVQVSAVSPGSSIFKEAVKALKQCEKCEPKANFGLLAYDPSRWDAITVSLSEVPEIVAAVLYTDGNASTLQQPSIPVLLHIAGQELPESNKVLKGSKHYNYTEVKSFHFATPFTGDFHYNSEALSHTRNLSFLKPKIGGPYFDLETIWDEHTYYEFADRSVQHTMSTMVQEPYVNHVPTLTGGVGRSPLSKFYKDSFIFSNSADTALELISRTIGIDRVIDEFVFKFTHDQEIPWMLPGIPPTNLKVEIPFTAVVNIRGDRLYHEHISWDQASVLKQLGLLPEYLPFPYPLPGKTTQASDKAIEFKVPVAGIETAQKLRDRNSIASNEMFNHKIRVVGNGESSGVHVNGHAGADVNGTLRHLTLEE